MPEALKKFMQLTKVDVAKNLIYGVFTAEVIDKSGEIADYETTKKAFEVWSAECEKISGGKNKGNIRKMHTAEIAGGAVSIDYDDVKKFISGCVEVTPEIARQAEKGWLNGFSIGGAYAKKWEDPVHKGVMRFTPILNEVSIVDNPCVPDATFEAFKDASFAVVKTDGTEEMRKFAPKPEDDIRTVYKAKDGSLHDTAELAMGKNKEIADAAKPASPVDEKLKELSDLAKDASEDKKAKLAKSMNHVAALADVVNQLHGITKSHEAEKGEDHPVTNKLKKHVRGMSDTLGAMADDEACDMNDEHAAKITQAKGLLKDWKEPAAEPDKAAAEKDAALTKAVAERDDLKKQLDAIPAKIEEAMSGIKKRLKTLEEQPAADTGPLFIVEKDKGIGEVTPIIARTLTPGDIRKL